MPSQPSSRAFDKAMPVPANVPAVYAETMPAELLSTPPTTTSAPTSDVSPEAMSILKNLEAAGEKYRTIKARVDYTVDMTETGETEARTGYVAYKGEEGKESAKFRISFDTLKQGNGPRIKDAMDYVFDGQWLWVAKHSIKQLTKYQVAAEGEKVESLKLGKGPFPMPFGQKASDVVEFFQVTTRPPTEKDPKGTRYLKLMPRREHRDDMNITRMEMWIDPNRDLPVKIVSEDKNANVTSVVFDNIQTGAQVDEALFTMARPAGWEFNVKKLE